MLPPMPDFVSVHVPNTGTYDRFGRLIRTEVTSSARVTFVDKTRQSEEGNRRQITAEIDLPPEMPVGYGYEITYKSPQGETITNLIVRVDAATDIANHVLYWTVQVAK
jgi:hypothetical protein